MLLARAVPLSGAAPVVTMVSIFVLHCTVQCSHRLTDGEETFEHGLDFDVGAGADVGVEDAGFFNPNDGFEGGDDSTASSSDSTSA